MTEKRNKETYEKFKGLNLFNYEEYKHLEGTGELWELYTSTKHMVMSFKDWLYKYCFENISIEETLEIGEMR